MRLDFAGYVWQNKEDFFTILSAHKTKNEAILTQCNLIEQGKDVEILQHSFPTFSLSQTLTEKEKNIFTKSINSFYDTYLELYDLSISLDTKLENELEIQEKIEKLLTEFEEVFVSFKTIFPANSNKTLTNLNDALLYFVECLSLLNKKEYKTQTQTYSSLIKHTYVEILDIYNDFINSINS